MRIGEVLTMDDLWRPVVGFEELYEVSSDGRVRKRNGEELHQRVDKKKYTNYRRVSLKGTNGTVNEFVHRIVAQAFLPQKEGCNIINHKDENGENNHVENLEWCNRSYNARYGSSLLKIKSAATGRISEKRKPVLQFDADGKGGCGAVYVILKKADKQSIINREIYKNR